MLSEEMTGRLVNEIRRFLIADAATLSKANDEQLRRRIADIVDHKLVNYRISPQERSRIVRLVFSSIRGMGILDEILADDSITEIMINGPFHIFVERAGRLEALNKKFASENELRNIIQKMVGSVGKEVNEANPIVDTRLADGSRVNVVLPPLSLSGPIVTIRKFSRTPMTVDQLLKYGSITPEAADFLGKLVRAKYNIFISGGTGSGKTTFLNAMSNFIPRDERIITIEDSAELQIANIDNIVSLETRNANTSGKGEVTIRDLIKSALRMRPEGCSMKYVQQFSIILLISVIGEILKTFLPLPVPASVYGLVIMLVALLTGILKLDQVKGAADFLVEIMPVMFVPAGAGLITAWSSLKPICVPVLIMTFISTVIVMVVTGKVTQGVIRMGKRGTEK